MLLYKTKFRLIKLVFLFLLICTVIFVPVVNYSIPYFLKYKIRTLESPNYKLKVNEIKFSLLDKNLIISKINIIVLKTNTIIDLKVDTLFCSNISLLDFLLHKTISIKQLHLIKPIIILAPTIKDPIKLSKTTPQEIPKIDIEKILISDLSLINVEKNELLPVMTALNIDVSIIDVQSANSFPDELLKNIKYTLSDFSFQQLSIHTTDNLYTGTIYQTKLSSKEHSIYIDSIGVKSNYAAKDFFNKVGKQTDLLEITTDGIYCKYDQLFNDSGMISVILPYLAISQPQIFAYRDKNYERLNDYKPTIQELLKSVKFSYEIKKLYALKGKAEYRELSKGADKTDVFRINKTDALITNITNKDSAGILSLYAKALLYEEGLVNTVLTFPLNKNYFTCSGFVKNIHFKKFNNVLAENLNVKLKGEIESIVWDFIGGEKESSGNMQFSYSDLKVKFQDKDTKKTSGFEEKLKSLVANLILRKNNDSESKNFATVPLLYQRDKTKFIFNYIAKTLLSGVKTTLGIKTKKKKDNKNKVHD